MKKIILISCIILLSSISLLFALEEFSTEPISLDEFIEEYLPDYNLQKRIPLEGIGRAYAVAKNSGNIVAITEIGDQFKVYYFDIEGNLKWTKDFDKVELYGSFHKVKSMDCEVADNGETICLYISPQMDFAKPTGFYGVINTILSKKGDVLYTKLLEGTWLIPSPDGKYLYKRTGQAADYWQPGLELYRSDGTLVNFKGFDYTKDDVNVRLKFVLDDHILAYIERKEGDNYSAYFRFLTLKNETVTTIWEYEIPVGQDLAYYFDLNVKLENNRILIRGRHLYVFDFEGNLLYFKDKSFYQSFDFLNANELFLQSFVPQKKRYSKLLNISTKEIIKEKVTLRYEENDYDGFRNAIVFNDILLLSVRNFSWLRSTFHTSIHDFANDLSQIHTLYHNVDSITKNDEKIFVFEKYNENPEIVILIGGEK
ncbi:hypothetical protein D4R71_07950 [bacterium]|nr:MAG: hypothetical protein D4R71_07950 [bacterium]